MKFHCFFDFVLYSFTFQCIRSNKNNKAGTQRKLVVNLFLNFFIGFITHLFQSLYENVEESETLPILRIREARAMHLCYNGY